VKEETRVVAEVIPLGSRLRQRREELGLTQAQAARQLDVARTAYRLWELEAARPAPDRWRAIAKWLDISMTAMLLAEELLDQQEAIDVHQVVRAAGLTDAEWDAHSDAVEGDYFSQERATITDQARMGRISSDQAANLRHVLARIQDATSRDSAPTWHAGRFRKRFASTSLAPALARAALATTAVGIPADDFDHAALLTSELVTNAVKHGDSEWVDVSITLGSDVLRIEVADQSRLSLRPRAPDLSGGWGLTLVGELATRWGVERQSAGKIIWIELDLSPSP
jgi:transcriptional regulator with XRE-family HTH domain/anti-sigma regulatory factor (Ser/Thr protein kinase)